MVYNTWRIKEDDGVVMQAVALVRTRGRGKTRMKLSGLVKPRCRIAAW